MTSMLTSYAQIPTRSSVLFAIAGDSGFTQLKLTNTISANPASVLVYDGTVLNTTNADTFIGYINYGRSYNTGELFKDLGKKLYLQTNGRIDYIFTYVQQINGPKAEGVPDNYNVNSTTAGNFWMCTWSAGGPGISMNVVRAG